MQSARRIETPVPQLLSTANFPWTVHLQKMPSCPRYNDDCHKPPRVFTMDFSLSEEQQMLVDTALDIGAEFGPQYWHDKDEKNEYPDEFLSSLSEHGFFSLGIDEEHGGLQAGMTEIALAMEALCRGGAGGGPALGYLFGTLGANIINDNASPEQKARYLPNMAAGESMCAFGLSEPDAGTNSLNMTTFAKRDGDDYIISGGKWYITNIERSDAIVLVARTEKLGASAKRADGVSLFLIDLPCEGITYQPIPKHAFGYYKSHTVFIDEARVPKEALVGEEGKGFYQVFGTLNPERILVAAGAIGIARLALKTAVQYAKERSVFGQPIGAHQAVQHPLAVAYAKLETAWVSVLQAATMHDQGASPVEVGGKANLAKYVAVEAAINACYHSMQTLGGNGFASEYHVERWWREVQLFRLAPVTQQMTLNFIGEHVLGLPKSY